MSTVHFIMTAAIHTPSSDTPSTTANVHTLRRLYTCHRTAMARSPPLLPTPSMLREEAGLETWEWHFYPQWMWIRLLDYHCAWTQRCDRFWMLWIPKWLMGDMTIRKDQTKEVVVVTVKARDLCSKGDTLLEDNFRGEEGMLSSSVTCGQSWGLLKPPSPSCSPSWCSSCISGSRSDLQEKQIR